MKQSMLRFSSRLVTASNVHTGIIEVEGLLEYKSEVVRIPNIGKVELEFLASYLNQLSLTIEKWRQITYRLIEAELTGAKLAKTLDDAVKMLCYSGMDEFVREISKKGEFISNAHEGRDEVKEQRNSNIKSKGEDIKPTLSSEAITEG